MAKYDFHLDAQVLAMSLLTVNPGFSGIGLETSGKRSDEIIRAAIETLIVGLAGTLITKSYIPLIVPFAYILAEHAYENSRAPDAINEAIEGNEAESWQ